MKNSLKSSLTIDKNILKLLLLAFLKTNTYNTFLTGGHSSVVERLVANEKVEGSTPFARSKNCD